MVPEKVDDVKGQFGQLTKC